jgi:hypothetical protein
MQAAFPRARRALRSSSLDPVSAMARCARCGHWRECRPLPEARGWLCVKRCYASALRMRGARRLLRAVEEGRR